MLGFYILFFIFGTAIGSFLNVVIIRLRTKESIFKDRSHCPFCKKELKWYELIPILSFIVQLGKCRKCKKKISWQYPLVEFFTGLVFVLVFNLQFSIFNEFSILQFINTIFLLLVSCFLIIIFVYDLKHYLVPDEVIYPAIVLTFVFRFLNLFRISPASPRLVEAGDFGFRIFFDYIIAAILGGTFFLIIVVVSRGKWMGLGDVKIGVLMGLLLGLPYVLVAIFLAFLIGAFVSAILLILKKKKLKSEIPFGPFLTGATFIVLFWGDILTNWYLGLF